MDKKIIQNWNSCINTDDEIYILGDFMVTGNGTDANNLVNQLKGIKYLIKGNHDKFIDDTTFDRNNFEWIKDYFVLNYKKIKFVLFHYPLFEWDGYFGDAVHLYGHVHNSGNNKEKQKRFNVLGKRAINVGVDLHNFFPVHIEKIVKTLENS